MTFGEKLKLMRKRKGYTLEDLAKKFNSSKTTFSNYENNYRKPDMNLIKDIADFFNVSVDWLLSRVEAEDSYIMEKEEIPMVLREVGVDYLEVTKEFKDKGFTAEEIRKVLKFADEMKNNNQ